MSTDIKNKRKKNKTKHTKKITCKYLKKDKYNNGIFIVSADSKELSSSYIQAKTYYKKLSSLYDTNLPIWIKKSKGFGTIRFKKNEKILKLKENAIYEVEFSFNETRNNKDNKFVNLNIIDLNLKLEYDNGLELDISDNDDGNETPEESESETESD